ncbi:MAG: acyl-CoA dehydratase activase [Parvibaculum sp.]|uniref:acyl-CoA dehydratase activase n=1 Tax=Parvibaculum sp. TaxID=2024848 RepID=UPI00273188A7|nr:acyl-CoA dehydratase activase [Parvibaculum sp.]MDP2151603.1 acyl-CoA dehydratase activase [Parvibaculum sp.]
MRALGIDIGSRFIKAVVVEGGRPVSFKKAETLFSPLENCMRVLDGMKADSMVVTGYGRHLLEVHMDAESITEIKAFARGARAVFPSCRTIIDIGGQDTKVISLDENGLVKKFEMNDRCAAGTGKFLEVMAKALGYGIEEFGRDGHGDSADVQISSMCTVFAESEVVSLISKGISRQAIAKAIHKAIAGRVIAMLKRVPVKDDVVFAGGCANNMRLKGMLEAGIGLAVNISSLPEMTGALGAALHAEQRLFKTG